MTDRCLSDVVDNGIHYKILKSTYIREDKSIFCIERECCNYGDINIKRLERLSKMYLGEFIDPKTKKDVVKYRSGAVSLK